LDGVPEHKSLNQARERHEERGDKESRKLVFASKVLNPSTHTVEPPFIGRRRDFYIPRLPSNLKHIPNVNMYMNVFYIS
jgi:hypothetical protein